MLSFPTEPMLAASARDLPGPRAMPGGSTYEPKFDGYRALIFTGPARGRVRVQSRRGADLTTVFPDVAEAAVRMLPPGLVLDGELVVWAEGRTDFGELQQRMTNRRRAAGLAQERPATFMAFDVLAVAERDVRGLTLADRRQLLSAVLSEAGPPLQQVPWTTKETVARGWLEDYAATPGLGIEGVVAKAAGGRYEPGRRAWLKVKTRETHDVLVGALIGTVVRGFARPRRLVLGYREPTGRLRIAGTTGELRSEHRDSLAGHLIVLADGELLDDGQPHPWPDVLTTEWGREPQRIIRVRPTLVVEVSADAAFDKGRWRHQVRFVRARPEEDARRLEPPRA